MPYVHTLPGEGVIFHYLVMNQESHYPFRRGIGQKIVKNGMLA